MLIAKQADTTVLGNNPVTDIFILLAFCPL